MRSSDSSRNDLTPCALQPIAIVGIGCRFPGGIDNHAAYWKLLTEGRSAIVEVPSDRWSLPAFYHPDPKAPGKTYSRWGGFLDSVDQFDPQFFRIAPREAVYIDPQQRLLLEVCWEALEDGGHDVDALAGSNAGVFIGISTHDYADMQMKDVHWEDAYIATGGALSIAANRVSYCLDLRGPSIAVDTACSSSLVSVHLACRSLWASDVDLALAGGVNCMLSPETTIGFSRATMLSPSGRCMTFDAAADGYVRGEGAGVVVLKRLRDAVADHDPIYATIIGTGINQDGHTNGLTMPNGEAQERLLRDVYAKAAVDPDRVLYVEAHGTATPVGDPIEAGALGAALGSRRSRGNLLRIGSVKTNIGHLEAAAGIAGLIKAALVVHHREIPPSLHFRTANPKIPMDALQLRVQREFEIVPTRESATVVGVNSFGFGGTNAHVVLDTVPPTVEGRAPAQTGVRLVPLSARTPDALRSVADTWGRFLKSAAGDAVSMNDLAYSAGSRRTHHDHRLAIMADSTSDLIERLDAYARSETMPGIVAGRRSPGRQPKIGFVFSGMGPQWWAMGRQLLESSSVFRQAVEECDGLFQRYASWSLIEELTAGEHQSRMAEAEVAQPANFALQIGLLRLWQSWGVVPDAIVGHSAGEVAASFASGITSLEDAVCVIYHRSRLQQLAAEKGTMLAVGLGASQAGAAIRRFERVVSVAAINSPRAVTLSGDQPALQQLARELDELQVFNRFVDTRVPYHSHYMDALRGDLLVALSQIVPQQAVIPFYSTVSGERVDGRELDASYWWGNIRQPVLFAHAIERLLDDGIDSFVELSPHPVLGRSIVEIQQERGHPAVAVLPSLRRGSDERATTLTSLATLYANGRDVNWQTVNGEGTCVRLPPYPWQRSRYWTEPHTSISVRLPVAAHPLLQQRSTSVMPTWESRLDRHELMYLRDHAVQGSVVFPAAGYVEAALAAHRESTGAETGTVEDVRFKRAFVLGGTTPPVMQVAFTTEENTFGVYSRAQDAGAWTLHATGRIGRLSSAAPARQLPLASLRAECERVLSQDRCYERLKARGLEYGAHFRGIAQIRQGRREALGEIRCPDALRDVAFDKYVFHPAMLDACFQVMIGAILGGTESGQEDAPYLPVEIARMHLYAPPKTPILWCHARITDWTASTLQGEFSIAGEDGTVIAEIAGFKCRRVAHGRSQAEDVSRSLYELQWLARALHTAPGTRESAFLPDVLQLAAGGMSQDLLTRYDRQQYYEEVEPLFNRLCAAYAWEALSGMGWTPQLGDEFDLKSLATLLQVVPEQQSHLTRLVEILEEDGIFRKSARGWSVVTTALDTDARTVHDRIREQYPPYEPDILIVERCGRGLADVLRGTCDQRQFLFPGGSLDEMFRAYSASRILALYNECIVEHVTAVVRSLPQHRTIRILEVGAGTGGTAFHVLPLLPAHRTEYVFTDVSEAFLAAAKQRFGDYPFVNYALLDIDRDPAAQGIPLHSFDIVIASDVLHAAHDLRAAISNVTTLLASNGMLIAVEFLRMWRAFDILFGPVRDWRRFPDGDPRSSYWLPRPRWTSLLRECGFVQAADISDDVSQGQGHQSVLLARGPEIRTTTAPAERNPRTWLVFSDDGGVANELSARAAARGDTVLRVSAGAVFRREDETHFQVRPGNRDDMNALMQAVSSEYADCRGVVHLWNLNASDEALTPDRLNDAQELGCISVLHLVQALSRAEGIHPRLWIATRGAQQIDRDETPGRPAQAMVWGLGRVCMNEQPQLRCTLVDLEPASLSVAPQLLEELHADDAEQEVAWRGEGRYVLRAVRARTTSPGHDQPRSSSRERRDQPFQLEAAQPGTLTSLRLREAPRREPGPGEVEIQIVAAGVNFRDVMRAMGLYNDRLGEPFRFGSEGAGVIARIGPGVKDLAVGEEVLALGPGCFGSFVTMPAICVVRKPAALTFEQAATIPMAFLTAHYALNYIGRLSSRDRVLIHSAAGGVGLAAVQLAQHAGASIFATAGNAEKQALLRSLGVTHVMDSHSLAFVDDIRSLTNGRGVDVVLNSLAGEYLARSVSLLAPNGRFLELGKVDFFENTRLGLTAFSRGLAFFGVDLQTLLENEPEVASRLFSELMEMMEAGTLQPLPLRTYPISEASDAFRFMAQGRHMGKIALALRGDPGPIVRVEPAAKLFREDATYLVTGGLRGFGFAMAEWMMREGASHFVLASRRGAETADAQAAVTRLQEAGATVVAAKADVTREEDVRALIDQIGRSMPPLRGVFHAAMVLDDDYLLQLDAERFRHVTAPKAIGALNLHRCTLDRDLDCFVMFSSIASIKGWPGQGNYAAGNSFLDALAHYRRAMNLPALTVSWGVISEVGYVARHHELAAELERQGLRPISPREAGLIIGRSLRNRDVHVAAGRIDFDRLQIKGASEAVSRRFSLVLDSAKDTAGGPPGSARAAVVELLRATPIEQRHEVAEGALRRDLARVLGIRESQIDPDQPLSNLGVDSLMSVELETVIKDTFGVTLPLGLLLSQDATLRSLSRRLADHVTTVND